MYWVELLDFQVIMDTTKIMQAVNIKHTKYDV